MKNEKQNETVNFAADSLDWRSLARMFQEQNINWHAQEWKDFIEGIEKKARLKALEDCERVVPNEIKTGDMWNPSDPSMGKEIGWNTCRATILEEIKKLKK